MKPEEFKGRYFTEATGDVKVGKIIFHIILLMTVLSVGGWGIHILTAPARTVTGIVDKTLDSDNVLYNYEWFKQQWEDYLAINQKIAIADASVKSFRDSAGPREKWTFEDKGEDARLSAISQGLKNQRNDLVATYNARSKMVNRSIFKSGVPATIEIGG